MSDGNGSCAARKGPARLDVEYLDAIGRADPAAIRALVECFTQHPGVAGLLDSRLFRNSSVAHFQNLLNQPEQLCSSLADAGNAALAAAVVGWLRQFPRHAAVRMLDVGCGAAARTSVAVLTRLCEEGRDDLELSAVLCDNARKVLSRAVPTGGRQDRFRQIGVWLSGAACVCADAWQLPVEDETVDVAMCGFVLHHTNLLDRREILEEMARVTRPGGIVAVVDECRGHEQHLRFLNRAAATCGSAGLECFVSPGELAAFLTASGLEEAWHESSGRVGDTEWIAITARKPVHVGQVSDRATRAPGVLQVS